MHGKNSLSREAHQPAPSSQSHDSTVLRLTDLLSQRGHESCLFSVTVLGNLPPPHANVLVPTDKSVSGAALRAENRTQEEDVLREPNTVTLRS